MSLQRRFTLTGVVAVLFAFASHSQAALYDLTITVDNAYVFGFGDLNGVAAGTLGPVVVNTTSSAIFGAGGPEDYTGIDSASYRYVYLAAWADDQTANGALASFVSNGVAQFSTGVWEVFATGDKTSTAAQALTLASINNQITLANGNNGVVGGSRGWVRSGTPAFPKVGSIMEEIGGASYRSAVPLTSFDPAFTARFQNNSSIGWMWYNNGASPNPFDYTAAGDGGWLIFRSGIPLLCDAAATGLWNTGVNGTGNVLVDGTLDGHYALLAGPAPVLPGDPAFKSGGNPGVWLANNAAGTPGSAWIGRAAVAAPETVGLYTYRLNVNVPNYSPLPTITGRWTSDNNGVDIVVNGGSTGQTQTAGFGQWQNFTIPGGTWTAGVNNTVDFVVNNAATFHGLRVEWCVSPSGAPVFVGVPALDVWGLVAVFAVMMGAGLFILLRH